MTTKMCNFNVIFIFMLFLLFMNNALNADNQLDSGTDDNSAIDPDENRNAVEIITSRGFKAEVHYVITKDDYILGIHRIVNPQKTNKTLKPILLQHGLFGSSTDFLINSPFVNSTKRDRGVDNNLGFLLSQEGYDVWLSNSRGNTYSRNHTKLSIKDKKFWRFTFDEMSEYDLTAIIKYILQKTNNTSIAYIGHSQGTAIMFALLSSKPDWAKYIDPFIALAPVAFVGNIISPIRYFSEFSNILRYIGGEFLPSNKLIKYLSEEFCDTRLQFICSNILFLMAGFDEKELNKTRLGVYFSHTPAGTSSWDVSHFGQMVRNKKFQKFDFGEQENQIIYGQKTPPEYQLESIISKRIALVYSSNDYLADPYDVQLLKQRLKVPLLDDYLVPYKQWTHLDFIFGKDAGVYVYPRVLNILNKP